MYALSINADTAYFHLQIKNVNEFVRIQKRAKANENVYCIFLSLSVFPTGM